MARKKVIILSEDPNEIKREKELSEKIKRILFASRQDTLGEAVLADLVDAIPIAGDICNAVRVADAYVKGDKLATALQAADTVAGLIPVEGEIFDIITPTNTILTLMKLKNEGKLEASIPLLSKLKEKLKKL